MIVLNESIITGGVDKSQITRIKNLLSTPVGSVPYDRNFGIDYSILDRPVVEAKVLLMAEIINKIRKYEPEIVSIEINFSVKGSSLIPLVVIKNE